MVTDSAGGESAVGYEEVMATVDGGRFLVADIARDDAWLSIRTADAPVLSSYR